MPETVHIGSGTPEDPWYCLRCTHSWVSSKMDEYGKPVKPTYCAKCRSAAWCKPPKMAHARRPGR